MLKSLLQLFERNDTEDQQSHTVELATAALLSEIIRADDEINHSELAVYKGQLYKQFNLPDVALEALMEEGQASADEAVDLVQFTKVINQKCDETQKWKILKGLWSVAYADSDLAPIEEHIIRRIADLLHVPHRLFIQAKLEVAEKR